MGPRAKTIVIIGSLDTKGDEIACVRDHIAARGHRTLVVDTGVLGAPAFAADVSRATWPALAGGGSRRSSPIMIAAPRLP